MTPMIDVVFLLLVFFVCASIGREPDRLLSTPLSGGAVNATDVVPEERPLGDVWIELARENDRTTATVKSTTHRDLGALEGQLVALAQLAPEIPVILDVADDVPMEDVLRVYHTSQRAGFQTIQFAAEAE